MTYEEAAKELRREIETVLHRARGSFSGGSLSIADVMTVIFQGGYLRLDPANPWKPDRDMLILSKGHCSSALYCSLARAGMFPKEELLTYGADGSNMIIHPKIHAFPGIETSSGSLGHGLALGTGSALAARIKGYDSRVFVIMGDGECNEGSVWENAAFAARQKLKNLIVVIDRTSASGFSTSTDTIVTPSTRPCGKPCQERMNVRQPSLHRLSRGKAFPSWRIGWSGIINPPTTSSTHRRWRN